MSIRVNIDGTLYDEAAARISVFDHGFVYGDGVYETLRTYNRRPFLLDRHLARLWHSARLIALPPRISDDEVARRIDETVAAAEVEEAYIRILLTRGVGELTYDPAACPSPTLVIIVKPHALPPPEVFERGVKVALVSVIRNHPGSVSPIIKSNNLLNNALAMQEAFRRGAFEGVMRNYRGELSECTQSNLFIVRGGAALTPPVDAGLLPGITRQFLFEIGGELGIPVREAVLRDKDLFEADEAFLTSTTRELAPIVQVDDRTIGSGRPGRTTVRLLEAFRRKAQELTSPQPSRSPA